MFIKNALNAVFDAIVRNGAASGMNELEFLEEELKRWMGSKERLDMKTGLAYYSDHQDIERKNRRAIGPNGNPVDVHNLPNFKIMDNQYGILVDQKNNYLLGRPVEVKTEGKMPTQRRLIRSSQMSIGKQCKQQGKMPLIAVLLGNSYMSGMMGN